MRPDFRRSELNEGQVEMKVDDDAHSIVPGSTSAYVQKNSVTTSGSSDNLLQQLLRLVTVQGCLLALCTLRRYSSSPTIDMTPISVVQERLSMNKLLVRWTLETIFDVHRTGSFYLLSVLDRQCLLQGM